MEYILSTNYCFEKIENKVVAINSEMEKVIIFGEIEQFILDSIVKVSEKELIKLACEEYGNNSAIADDVHRFIQSLIEEEIIVKVPVDGTT